MMIILRILAVLLLFPAFAFAGEDHVPTLEEELRAKQLVEAHQEVSQMPRVKPAIGFELPLYGERLPNESFHVSTWELDPANETAELVLLQYSGDEGCCTDIVVLTNTLDGWKTIDFSWGLEEGTQASDFIMDLDGDGTNEIVIDKIYKIEDGTVSEKECSKFEMIGPDKTIKRCTDF